MAPDSNAILDPALVKARDVVTSASADDRRPVVASFFDPATATYSYVIHDPITRTALIADPVLDFDAAAGRIAHRSAAAVVEHVEALDLKVDWILETHVHADHLSAAAWLRRRLGGSIAIGNAVNEVRDAMRRIFGDAPFDREAAFDVLMDDGTSFMLGGIPCIALHVPGHTPADMAFVIGDAVLVGDTLFQPDCGTARADFPGGDARRLYRSIRRLLNLPHEARLLHCHDYPPTGREAQPVSTVAAQREGNIHVRDGIDEEGFVDMRTARDATLAMPALLLPSVQVNLQGDLPPASPDGRHYLTLPIDAL